MFLVLILGADPPILTSWLFLRHRSLTRDKRAVRAFLLLLLACRVFLCPLPGRLDSGLLVLFP